jgi:hypothetical protein
MAAKDMTDALQNPHPEVPFSRVRGDTISALADLAAIFKLKLRQTPSPTPQAVPPTLENLELYHAPITTNEITDNNSHTRHLC